MNWTKDEFQISTDPALLDIPYIHTWLSQRSYWAKDLPLGTLKAAIDGSVCFGLYHAERQIGFARVITDKATFGYLADVFIDEAFRGRGLSKWLMTTVMEDPSLQGFRTWLLHTRDAHGLYTQSGFSVHPNPERVMIKNDPEIYTRIIQAGAR